MSVLYTFLVLVTLVLVTNATTGGEGEEDIWKRTVEKILEQTKVVDWLRSINKLNYKPNFLDNGYERMDLIEEIREINKLHEIGIKKDANEVFKEIQAINPNKEGHDVTTGGHDDVTPGKGKGDAKKEKKAETEAEKKIEKWLDSKGYKKYWKMFTKQGYDSLDFIMEITTETELTEIGVDKKDAPKLLSLIKGDPGYRHKKLTDNQKKKIRIVAHDGTKDLFHHNAPYPTFWAQKELEDADWDIARASDVIKSHSRQMQVAQGLLPELKQFDEYKQWSLLKNYKWNAAELKNEINDEKLEVWLERIFPVHPGKKAAFNILTIKQYLKAFKENKYTFDKIKNVKEDDFKKMGIVDETDKKKLLKGIAALKEKPKANRQIYADDYYYQNYETQQIDLERAYVMGIQDAIRYIRSTEKTRHHKHSKHQRATQKSRHHKQSKYRRGAYAYN